MVAPSAGADDNAQVALQCSGARALGHLNPGITFDGTQVKATTSLFTDLLAKPTKIGGSCTAHIQHGGQLAAFGGKAGVAAVPTTLNPASLAATLTGFGSCNSAPSPATTETYPLNGQVVQKYTQTYTDTVTSLTKNFSSTAYIVSDGFNPAGPDVVDVQGIGTKGLGAGAPLTGEFYFDPIKKPVKGTDWDTDGLDASNNPIPTSIAAIPSYDAHTGYMLDLNSGLACFTNTGSITLIEVGTGGTSLLGSTLPTPGFKWQLPA